MLVPQSISDDSILRIARNHRQGRFPVAVWRHQYNKATLLRAGGIERSTIGSIMRQTKTVSGSGVTHHAISSSASVEQEKYFAAVGRYPLACKAFPLPVFKLRGTGYKSMYYVIINRKPTKTERSHQVLQNRRVWCLSGQYWTRYSHSKSPKFFGSKIYILRHQEKCLAIKAYLLVIGKFSVLNSSLLFKLDVVKSVYSFWLCGSYVVLCHVGFNSMWKTMKISQGCLRSPEKETSWNQWIMPKSLPLI